MQGKLTAEQVTAVLNKVIRSRRKMSLELHYDGSGEDGFVLYVTKKRIESGSDTV